jgi:hypothetical protein
MSTAMFQSSCNRDRLFLLVRSHSQMQYYLNVPSTRRAANDAVLGPFQPDPAKAAVVTFDPEPRGLNLVR